MKLAIVRLVLTEASTRRAWISSPPLGFCILTSPFKCPLEIRIKVIKGSVEENLPRNGVVKK